MVDRHEDRAPRVHGPLAPVEQLARLALGSSTFEAAYKEWKAARIADEAVRNLFGEEWMFFFQLNRGGDGVDTMEGLLGRRHGGGEPREEVGMDTPPPGQMEDTEPDQRPGQNEQEQHLLNDEDKSSCLG